MKNSEGFVYVATGKGYLVEACRSVLSLKKHHPAHPVCLISDLEPSDSTLFDDFILCPDIQHMPIDKTLLLRCPYERLVFLDTDTEVFGDLTPLFHLLHRFDLALLQDINRGWDYELPGVPAAFSEFNTGVMALRKSPSLTVFFDQWKMQYQTLFQQKNITNDQASFRMALFHSDLRVAPLPEEFNFLADFPNYLLGTARLLHGRGNLQTVHSLLAKQTGMRIYIPELGTLTEFRGRWYWFRSLLSFIPGMVKLLFYPPKDYASLKPKQWWKKEWSGPC